MRKYSLLSSLMKEELYGYKNERYEEREAQNFFSQFKLFAFVISDYEDLAFLEYMTKNFSILDKITGANLLFFSLVKPTIEIQYELRSYFEPKDVFATLDTYQVNDALYQHALLEALNVSRSDLPAIVVTPSLISTQWYIVKIGDNINNIPLWLMTLANLAKDDEFNNDKLTEILDLNLGSWYSVEGAPLCDLLAAVESAAAITSSYQEDSNKSKKIGTKTKPEAIFDGVFTRLMGHYSNKTDEEQTSKWSIQGLLKYLKLIRDYPEILKSSATPCSSKSNNILSARKLALEPDSKHYLDVFAELSNAKVFQKTGDYSVLTSLLHKVFEKEINASVLQLMRSQVHIKMPDFYNEYCNVPGNYSIQTRYENVNLNRYVKGNPRRYSSPGLGMAQYAFRTLLEYHEFRNMLESYGIDETNQSRFADLWAEIFQLRNLESHCTIISEDQYWQMHENVSEVIKQYFPKLVSMKHHLSGTREE